MAIAIAEACIGNNYGATIRLTPKRGQRIDELLFGEVTSQILVAIEPNRKELWEAYLNANLNGYWQKIGEVTDRDSDLKILTNDNISLINVKIEDILSNLESSHRNQIECLKFLRNVNYLNAKFISTYIQPTYPVTQTGASLSDDVQPASRF